MDPTFRPSQNQQANVTSSQKRKKYLLLFLSIVFLSGICVVLLVLWSIYSRIIYGIFFCMCSALLIFLSGYVQRKRRQDFMANQVIFQINQPGATNQDQLYVPTNYMYQNSGNFTTGAQPRNININFGPIIQTPSGIISSAPVDLYYDPGPITQTPSANISSAPVDLYHYPGNNVPMNPYLSNRADPIAYPNEGNTSNQPNHYQSMSGHNPVGGNLNDLKLYGLDDLPPSYGTVLDEKYK